MTRSLILLNLKKQVKLTIIVLALLFQAGICFAAEAESKIILTEQTQIKPPLKSPFNSNLIRRNNAIEIIDFKCSKPVAPPENLTKFVSVYKDDDKTRSIIDEEKKKNHKEYTKQISIFEREITKMANVYITAQPPPEEVATCAMSWIKSWADKGALLGDASNTGQAVRKWTLASIASAWLQIKHAESLDYNNVYMIDRWLKKVAYQVKADYSTRTDKNSRNNNHIYWAAWSIAATAISINDRGLFDWSMDKAKLGISQIEQDGSLPLEMNRMGRALHYHIFATAPLILMAEAGQINGYNLYNQNQGAIHRLVHLIVTNIKNPEYFEKITGTEQDTSSILKNGTIGWLETYNARFPLKENMDILNLIEKKFFHRNGGDLNILFRKKINL